MDKVYYNGKAYDFVAHERLGSRQYSLYENGQLVKTIYEDELDKRTSVSAILDSYYEELMSVSTR